jgi:hypothetical protein
MLRIMHLEHGISEISGPCLHLRGAWSTAVIFTVYAEGTL